MEFIEDSESTEQINVSNIDDMFSIKKAADHFDPFNIEEEELKKVRGLSPTFRRKMSREFTKAFTGREETGTQQNLLAQAITGYAMFDLIQPIYNLEYLSKVYEVSTYNYAAINAKVSNVVGLGYSFVETRKTNDAFDAIDRKSTRLNSSHT